MESERDLPPLALSHLTQVQKSYRHFYWSIKLMYFDIFCMFLVINTTTITMDNIDNSAISNINIIKMIKGNLRSFFLFRRLEGVCASACRLYTVLSFSSVIFTYLTSSKIFKIVYLCTIIIYN